MSYDLYFCRQGTRGPSASEFADWAKISPFLKQSAATQFWYNNENTGVYFSFDVGPNFSDGDSPIPAAYLDAEIAFNINYARPSFFGLEAMPLVEQLQVDLDLLAMNPQGNEDDLVRRFRAGELIENWSATNERSYEMFYKQGGSQKTRIEREKSISAWKYNFDRSRLEESAADALAFVPHVYYVRVRDSSFAETMFAWTEGIPTVIPVADWVAMPRKKKKLFGKDETEVIFASASQVLGKVGDLLQDFETTRHRTKILHQQNVAKANRALQQIFPEMLKGECQSIAADDLQET